MKDYFRPAKVPGPAIAAQLGKSCRIGKDCEKAVCLCGKTSAAGFIGEFMGVLRPGNISPALGCVGDGYAMRSIVRRESPAFATTGKHPVGIGA
jgi:hypothetical protein